MIKDRIVLFQNRIERNARKINLQLPCVQNSGIIQLVFKK